MLKNDRTREFSGFCIALGGTIFSGYLSAIRLTTDTCAFDEPCPSFLSVPACYFGFGLFSILLVTSALALLRKMQHSTGLFVVRTASLAGFGFAGFFMVREVVKFLRIGSATGQLSLPTCAYGLVFFLALLLVSFHHSKPATATSN